MRRCPLVRSCISLTLWLIPAAVAAQAPAPAAPAGALTPAWTGNAGFGFSLNRGNTATTNLNASFEATDDPKTGSVWKFKGLYLRGDTNGALAVDRLDLSARNERTLTERVYAYAAVGFIEDQFKDIDALVAPNAGLGYKFLNGITTTLSADAGLGAQIEKDTGFDQRTNLVITASDKFEHKLSKTASITQGFTALWKTRDLGDAIYTFSAGTAAALTARTQLKLELLDTDVTRPVVATVKSNDVALLTTFVYKF